MEERVRHRGRLLEILRMTQHARNRMVRRQFAESGGELTKVGLRRA